MARATVQLMKAARMKLRMTAGPASSMAAAVPRRSPVPMEPPTATMVICPAVSWWRRPDSGFENSGFEDGAGMRGSYSYIRSGSGVTGKKVESKCQAALGLDGRGAHPHTSNDWLGRFGGGQCGWIRFREI